MLATTQVCHLIRREKKDGNLLPLLLQATFASPSICTCRFHMFGLSMLSNVVNKTAVTMALNIGKKHGIPTNWPNIATKFARRGTVRNLLLSDSSSWHPAASATQLMEFASTNESPTSPGESGARLPAGPWPHRHLWSCRQSTWSDQKGDGGVYTAPREDGISKKVRLCHLSPNPPKASPLWGVGPIII